MIDTIPAVLRKTPLFASLTQAEIEALTVGFISVMVLSIGERILPAVAGMHLLWSSKLMLAALLLLSVGCTAGWLGSAGVPRLRGLGLVGSPGLGAAGIGGTHRLCHQHTGHVSATAQSSFEATRHPGNTGNARRANPPVRFQPE